MTFYERERNRRTGGLQEIQVGAQVDLQDAVVRGERVSRVVTVVDADTLRIEHHRFGYPGTQLSGWPLTREYDGGQVNNARLWKKNENPNPATDKRIVWKPTPKQ